MSLVEIIKNWWSLIVAFAGFVVWLARLENKAMQNSKDLERLEKRLASQRAEDKADREKDWVTLQKSLSIIEGDIKELLQRTSHGSKD